MKKVMLTCIADKPLAGSLHYEGQLTQVDIMRDNLMSDGYEVLEERDENLGAVFYYVMLPEVE